MDEDRRNFTGNWQCSDCGKPITELPFKPNEGQALRCKECYMAKGGGRRGSSARPSMVQGNWQCSECNKEITQLPFKPREGNPVMCLDCYRSKNPR